MDTNAIANRALESGENTSEHEVMTTSGTLGKIIAGLGTVIGLITPALALADKLPDGLKNSPYIQIGLIGLGAVIAVAGILKSTLANVAYIQSRGLVKANALAAAGQANLPPA